MTVSVITTVVDMIMITMALVLKIVLQNAAKGGGTTFTPTCTSAAFIISEVLTH